jgi:catechol 2,3-dioxygenase-like lactoylglutathione lyase family enzyme
VITEVTMTSTQTSGERVSQKPNAGIDMKLEVVVIPVSDVDRAKRFYAGLGWRLDADFGDGKDFRVVQLTPRGSQCSIHFGNGVTPSRPGSLQNLYLVVDDVEAARAELIGHGVDVSEAFHYSDSRERVRGPDPERRSYRSFAAFSDPDGNGWLLQEIKTRLPGRV